MKNVLTFSALAILLCTIHGCLRPIKSNLIPIEKGIAYNIDLGVFQFDNNIVLKNYLYKIKKNYEEFKNNEELVKRYTLFESNYKHKSLRKYISNKESLSFANDTWSEENDPDNFFIQDDILRLILNENVEIVVNNHILTVIDNCKIIQIDKSDVAKLNTLRKARKDLYAPFNSEGYNALNYCNESNNTQRVCCEKNDRTQIKYLEYTKGRKLKAVFEQRNNFFGFHSITAKTKNYKQKSNGNWEKGNADKISTSYIGHIYQEGNDGSNCADTIKVEPVSVVFFNDDKATQSQNFSATFWTRSNSITSAHYAEYDYHYGAVNLCLTNDCGGCIININTGSTYPKHFWTTDINGEGLPKPEYHKEGIAFNSMPSDPNIIPVYRFFDSNTNTHFWTTDIRGKLLPKPAFKIEGIAFFATQNGSPVYRYLHSQTGYNFWTSNQNEISTQSGFHLEGVAFNTPNTGVPVYRFISSSTGNHFWTTDPNGEGLPKPEYQKEGIAFYSASPDPNIIPVYRFYDSNSFTHFWTTDIGGESLPQPQYIVEGVAFFASKSGSPVYRYLHSKSGYNFWTIDLNEVSSQPEYQLEGIAFYAPTTGIPVYRWYND